MMNLFADFAGGLEHSVVMNAKEQEARSMDSVLEQLQNTRTLNKQRAAWVELGGAEYALAHCAPSLTT